MQFLQQYYEEGEAFLQQIVRGDETWVHHYEPSSKHQSMKWKHILPRTKKLKCAFCQQSDVDTVLGL
jgi:predicted SprT family Zn-dependent metalloprotease